MTKTDADLLDDAARAGWLYYVGGRTQDEIAKSMGVSRQRAQRLVSKAVGDGLVRIRLEHPIAELMTLAQLIKDKYNLEDVRIAPDVGANTTASLAPFAAAMLEDVLLDKTPRTLGFGTGRALRATVEHVQRMECTHHRLVSVIGNIAPDATASVYDVIMRLTDIVGAPHYPMPTPVFAEDAGEKALYMRLKAVKEVLRLAEQTDAIFVGVGQMDETAPLLLDGFLAEDEWRGLLDLGAVGEVAGRAYDTDGRYLDSPLIARMMSFQVRASDARMVVGIACGKAKIEPLRAAIKGRIINALVTDESSGRALLR